MAVSGNQNGFRTLLRVQCDDETEIKCFVYLDFTKMKIIKDIEDHVKSVLAVDTVSLFVDDIWLPSSETIHIIKQDDRLVAKKTAIGGMISCSPSKEVTLIDEPVKKRRRKKEKEESKVIVTTNTAKGDAGISIDVLFKELQNKRIAIAQKSENNCEDNTIIQSESSMIDKGGHNEDDGVFISRSHYKKKRIRKHKRKTVTITASLPSRPEVNKPSIEAEPCQAIGTHKRFTDDGDVEDSTPALLQEKVSKDIEPVKTTENKAENKESSPEKKVVELERTPTIYIAPELKQQLRCTPPSGATKLTEATSPAAATTIFEQNTNPNIAACESIENIPTQFVNVPNSLNAQNNPDNEDLPRTVEDWKIKLLSMAAVHEKESKLFYRKLVQDSNQTA